MIDESDDQPRKRYCHRHGGLWFALVLIIVGLVLLLQNFDLVTPAIWQELIKFWPVLLMIAGLEIILGKSAVGQLLLVIITLGVLFVILSVTGIIPPAVVSGLLR